MSEHKKIPKALQNLLFKVANMPDDVRLELANHLDAVVDDTMNRRGILKKIQEALSLLRLDLTYMKFDLEATRRERDEALLK